MAQKQVAHMDALSLEVFKIRCGSEQPDELKDVPSYGRRLEKDHL